MRLRTSVMSVARLPGLALATTVRLVAGFFFIEEFEGERAWWGDEADGFKSRVENEQAWRVSIDTIKAGNFNLDLKNPHNPDTGPGDVDHLLPEYEKLLAQIAATRGQLKAQLMEALTKSMKDEC